MIGFLRGRIAHRRPPSLVLDVSGVGYEVEAPMSTFYSLPEVGVETTLVTHLVVREDAHILYGFATEEERVLFRTLIKVSGVGPRLALTILSGISVEGFHGCVLEHDVAALVRLPGIGKKTAERLIVELRDRLPELAGPRPAASSGSSAPVIRAAPSPAREATSALVALGYKQNDAERMVKAVTMPDATSEELIRLALQAAGGR